MTYLPSSDTIEDVIMNNQFYSVDIEKNCIAGLLKYPKIYFDIPSDIDGNDFYLEKNRLLYPIIAKFIKDEKIELNSVLIAERINKTGYAPKDNFSITEYLDSLSLIQISREAVLPSFQELKKYSICRELDRTANEIKSEIAKNITSSAQEIITKVDSVFGHKIDIYSSAETQFTNIFEGLGDFLKLRGENPVQDRGIITPYKNFNKYYGGYRPGNVYVWASRTGQGKSTLLNDIASYLSQTTHNGKTVKVLYLDTEMETDDVKLRNGSALTDVPLWFLDTGKFAQNDKMNRQVIQEMLRLNAKPRYLYHHQVSNMDIERLISLIRRWYYQMCESDPNVQPVIVYDYLKLTGERVSGDWKEYQIMGEKINRLKELATQIKAPLLTAIQINRSGAASGREEIIDDETVISLSDRVSWFCSYLGIFRRKTNTEVNDEGRDSGTHKMITLKARFQGESAQGHETLIKTPYGYKQNYINYYIKNFKVEERFSLEDLVQAEKQNKYLISKQADASLEETDYSIEEDMRKFPKSELTV